MFSVDKLGASSPELEKEAAKRTLFWTGRYEGALTSRLWLPFRQNSTLFSKLLHTELKSDR